MFIIEIVDLKIQLLGWSNSMDENFDETDENHSLQSPEVLVEESSQNVPKRLADLRNQLENKQYALTAAQEASTFDSKVRCEFSMANNLFIFASRS